MQSVSTAIVNDDGTILLSEAKAEPVRRIITGIADDCFSTDGGIPDVAVILIGGEPGAGKSTIALQIGNQIAKREKREILYIAAEEGAAQVKDRTERLKLSHIHKIRLFPLGNEHELGEIIQRRLPACIILDSIQGMSNDLQQQVDICKTLKGYADKLKCPVLVVSHVTKENDVAGLMDLQHEVDTVMRFINDDEIRILEIMKNRFGPSDRVALFRMTQLGLVDHEDEDEDEDE